MTRILGDPWADVPPPSEPPDQRRRALQVRTLAGVAVPDIERLTTATAMPLFAGTLAAIVGPSETGKTTLAAHAVLDVVTAGGVALIFDGEMSAAAWRRKLEQLGANDDQLRRVLHSEMSADSADVQLVRAFVREHAVRLIVWDSALSLISRTCRSENDNSEVGRLMDRLRDIVRDGPAGLVVDHSPKDSASPVSRGASAKFAALDISYGIRLADGSVPGPLEPWSTIVSVEKDRHALLGNRADREAIYAPLGHGAIHVEIAELGTSSHRLSTTNPVDAAVERIAALDPPPVSGNDAYKRAGGTRTVVLAAYRRWFAQGGSGGSRSYGPNHRTTSSEPVRTTEPLPIDTTTQEHK